MRYLLILLSAFSYMLPARKVKCECARATSAYIAIKHEYVNKKNQRNKNGNYAIANIRCNCLRVLLFTFRAIHSTYWCEMRKSSMHPIPFSLESESSNQEWMESEKVKIPLENESRLETGETIPKSSSRRKELKSLELIQVVFFVLFSSFPLCISHIVVALTPAKALLRAPLSWLWSMVK